jgi:hypothetical protein
MNMFFRILTIINTLALVFIFVFGGLNYNFYGLVATDESEEVGEEDERLISQIGTDSITDPLAEDEDDTIEPDDTLQIKEDGALNGFVDLTGYMVTENESLFGDTVESSYFVFAENTDETILEFIDDLILDGNTINKKISSMPALGLGCYDPELIENQTFNIDGNLLTQLKASSATKKIGVRAFFGDVPAVGGACLSFLTNLQLVNN